MPPVEVRLHLRSWAKFSPGVAVYYHLGGFSRLGKGEDGFYDRMNATVPANSTISESLAGLVFIHKGAACRPYFFAFSGDRNTLKVCSMEFSVANQQLTEFKWELASLSKNFNSGHFAVFCGL